MKSDGVIELHLPDVDATRQVGAQLGRAARAGDVVAAIGTLGAGKTTLAQGLARGLGVPAEHYVNSPTFAIMQVHPGRVPFHHIDLYRISDPDEALGLGLDEVIGTDGVAFVEWPARLPEVMPADALWIELSHDGDTRRVRFSPRGPRSASWLRRAFEDERLTDFDG